jgi:hypothetical protein
VTRGRSARLPASVIHGCRESRAGARQAPPSHLSRSATSTRPRLRLNDCDSRRPFLVTRAREDAKAHARAQHERECVSQIRQMTTPARPIGVDDRLPAACRRRPVPPTLPRLSKPWLRSPRGTHSGPLSIQTTIHPALIPHEVAGSSRRHPRIPASDAEKTPRFTAPLWSTELTGDV